MIAIDCRVVGTNTGVDYYTRDLVRALASLKKAGQMLLLINDAGQQQFLPKTVEVKMIPLKRVLVDHFRFYSYVADKAISAVIHPDNTAFLFDHPNSIVILHDVLPWLHPDVVLSAHPVMHQRQRFYLSMQEKALKKTRKIVTVSATSKKEILTVLGRRGRRVESDRVIVIPESVDPVFSTPPKLSKQELLGTIEGDRYCFYIGGFEKNKNVIRLIDAFERSNYPGYLVLGGDLDAYAEKDEIMRFVAGISKHDRVRFPGKVDTDTLNAYFHYADFFVYVAFFGGFGRPILEALKAGCPVICSAIGSYQEVGGEAVVYVDPADTGSLAGKMDRLGLLNESDKRTLRERMTRQAALFNWPDLAARVWAEATSG